MLDGGATSCTPSPRAVCDSFEDPSWTAAAAGFTPSCVNGATTVREAGVGVAATGGLVTVVPNNASTECRCELVQQIPGPWERVRIRARVYVEEATLTNDFMMLFRAGFASDTGQVLVFVVLTQQGVRLSVPGATTSAPMPGPLFPLQSWVDVVLDVDRNVGATFSYGSSRASIGWSPLTTDAGVPRSVLYLGGSRFTTGMALKARYDDLEFRSD
jgi:hypothetical protein